MILAHLAADQFLTAEMGSFGSRLLRCGVLTDAEIDIDILTTRIVSKRMVTRVGLRRGLGLISVTPMVPQQLLLESIGELRCGLVFDEGRRRVVLLADVHFKLVCLEHVRVDLRVDRISTLPLAYAAHDVV